MSEVRIGFVGVGNMGQCAHLRNYAVLPECRVVALAELRPQLAERVAARYSVPKAYETAQEMLAHEQLDGLVASQPFTRHGQILPALYNANLPVFSEKPLASSVTVGRQLVAELATTGSWHMVGYHKRSDPAVMWAKAEIDRLKNSGELGPLRYVRVVMPEGNWSAEGFSDLITSDEPMPLLENDPPDQDEAASNEYVTFVNYYIHQVNLLRHLLGEPYEVAYADPSKVLLVARAAGGVCGTIEMSPYRTTVDWQESALVAFERGWIKLDLPAPMALNRPGRVEAYYDPGNGIEPRSVVPQLPWVHAMRQQAANFVRAIKGEIAPMCDAAEALQDLMVARDYLRLQRAG